MQMSKEEFDSMTVEARVDALFRNQCGSEALLQDVSRKMDIILSNTIRIYIPPISKKTAIFIVLLIAAVLSGDIVALGKVIIAAM